MATTDEIQTDDPTTHDDPPAETAPGKSGSDPAADKATEQLRAEAERLKKALHEANRKAAADRKRLEYIDNEEKQREDQKLGEADRLRKQLKELEDKQREAEQRTIQLEADLLARRIDQEIERYAINHFVYPELASRLVDRDRISYDPDMDKVSGIKDAVEAVLKKYPTLGGAARGGGSPAAMRTRQPGGGGGGGSERDRSQGLREDFAKMGSYEPM